MPFCPNCGVEVLEEQNYCRECGMGLYERTSTEPEQESARETTEESGDAVGDVVKTEEEYDDEGLISFSLSYPVRAGYSPVLIGGGLGVLYGFLLYSLYFVAIFLLFPLALVGSAGWEGVGGEPATSAALILVVLVGYLAFYLVSLLPLYPVAGYYVELTEHAAVGEVEPPEFDDWGDLFRDGVKSLVLIALPLYVLTSVVSFAPVAAAEYYAGYPFEVLGWVAYVVSILLWLYFAPPLLVNYSVHRSLRDAYDPSRFREFAANPDYLVYFLESVLLILALLVVGMVVGALSLITLVGWIFVVPAAVFYGYSVMAAFWGRVYYVSEAGV